MARGRSRSHSADRRAFLRRASAAVLAGGVGVVSVAGYDATTTPSALVAGSLQSVVETVGDATVEAHGSVAARRLVAEGARDPDALALADPRLFDGLDDRPTLFATNALVLALNPASPFEEEFRRDWRAALSGEAVVGRTDPDRDPLGYRTVMALELAGLSDALAETTVLPETQLLRNLEAGAIDAAFAYRNMAVEHDVPHVELPREIDFSTPALADHYATVSVELSDRTVHGAPIRYAATALTDVGEEWVRTLVSSRETLRKAGFGVPGTYPKIDSG